MVDREIVRWFGGGWWDGEPEMVDGEMVDRKMVRLWDGEMVKWWDGEPEMVDGEGVGGHHDHHGNVERQEAEKWISTVTTFDNI